MDPYGARAMRYVQDHCPTRFATIPDPVGLFTALGQEIRDQVEVTEEAIMAAQTVPGEEFTETLGRWKTARLMAEEQVFFRSWSTSRCPRRARQWATTSGTSRGRTWAGQRGGSR